jgi:hypothetical protein
MTADPATTDFVTRLVDAIKSAMDLSNAPAAAQQPAAQAGGIVLPSLRAILLVAAAIMLALWGWSLTPAIQNWNNPNEDGFSMLPAFYATPTLLPLGLIMLAGAISGKAEHARRARVALVIAMALVVLIAAIAILMHLT